MEPEVLKVPKNHVVFFSQALIHAGSGYWYDNVRGHIYFDHVNVPRAHDTTNPLPLRFGDARAALFKI